MTTKEMYKTANQIIRSSKWEKVTYPQSPRKSYNAAFKYAQRLFGDNIATAAYNSEIMRITK